MGMELSCIWRTCAESPTFAPAELGDAASHQLSEVREAMI